MADQNTPIAPDKLIARERTNKLWRYMQWVEKNRHLAEQLEHEAASGSAQDPKLFTDIAAQLREIAEQLHALSSGVEVRPLQAGLGRARG